MLLGEYLITKLQVIMALNSVGIYLVVMATVMIQIEAVSMNRATVCKSGYFCTFYLTSQAQATAKTKAYQSSICKQLFLSKLKLVNLIIAQ